MCAAEPIGFAFSAIVGQDRMKLALRLAVIDPSIGGVLVRGTKGTAKSTAVRALAALLPELEVVAGCPFNRSPGDQIEGWPVPEPAAVLRRRVPLVELPIGATEDRVLGSINLERAIQSGACAFEPGLLAAANRGVLYIDEVNLLADHLVDILLDAAAMGTNHVEREGISVSHPARFVLVGTMNPEEGGLRPQLLDRFGLAADAEDLADGGMRSEAVRRRIAFEQDPAAFASQWRPLDQAESERIVQARQRLPHVLVPQPIVDEIARLCLDQGSEGLRGDLTLYKAARAHAAYEGRGEVQIGDVQAVQELALGHRRTRGPSGPDPLPSSESRSDRSRPHSSPDPTRPRRSREGVIDSSRAELQSIAGHTTEAGAAAGPEPTGSFGIVSRAARLPHPMRRRSGRFGPGRTPFGDSPGHRGLCIGAIAPHGRAQDLAVPATLRAAAPHQAQRRSIACPDRILLEPHDLRVRRRQLQVEHLILLVVDTSRSMGAYGRMREVKGALLSLLVNARRQRNRVGMITFQGQSAALVLPPTRSVPLARKCLERMGLGGTTPLAHALELTREVTVRAARQHHSAVPLVVLLTDGRSNVSLFGGDPWLEAVQQAAQLRRCVRCLVVDTEAGPVRLGRARMLADILRAPCYAPEQLISAPLAVNIQRELLRPLAG
jgi:magnesium chelatase subunit D